MIFNFGNLIGLKASTKLPIMRKLVSLLAIFATVLLLSACKNEQEPLKKSLTVKNNLGFNREEVVSIPKQKLTDFLKKSDLKNLHIKKSTDSSFLRTQWIDTNNDGKNDAFLFLAEVKANASVDYQLVIDSTITEPESDVIAYSRFVPERTDDYTWENDKVAFRTYGPTGQKEFLEGVPGSTMSSGIDLWLKRTPKSIINEWYAGYQDDPRYYHVDRGEGYDPYHVGGSRGTGGIGVWEDDSLYVSKNFTTYKTIADGPLRTVFELSYAPWSPYNVNETKRITLDLRSNFSKFEIKLSAEKDVPNYAVGISLHENEGTYAIHEDEGWVSHWEKIDDAFVGEGVVMSTKAIDSAFARKSEVPDQSNLLIISAPTQKLTYYAGFSWQKEGTITTKEDWDEKLRKQAMILQNPLEIQY